MDNKVQKIVIALLSIIIVLLLFQHHTDKKSLDAITQRISNIETNLYNEYNQITNAIYRLENNITKNMSLVKSYEFKYEEVDPKNSIVTLNMNMDLKEIKGNSNIYVTYTPLGQTNVTEVLAVHMGGTSYNCKIPVSMKYNYKFNIIEKSKDGDLKELNLEEIEQHVYNDFYADRAHYNGSSIGENSVELDYIIEFSNNTYNTREYSVDKVEFFLFYNDENVYYEDVSNKVRDKADSYEYQVSGDSTMGMEVKKEYEYSSNINIGTQNLRFQTKVLKDEIFNKVPELDEDQQLMGLLQYKVKIILINGEEIDLQ